MVLTEQNCPLGLRVAAHGGHKALYVNTFSLLSDPQHLLSESYLICLAARAALDDWTHHLLLLGALEQEGDI